ncbi:NAD(P)-dependent oxidoreductase [Cryobacterium sp. PH29-G1]|uniref:NAD(P)-dependent oxidoreductase n=1 Tax=Cryobacterium sp. PH29-G1 TaxID=3046211 RepID=UPI0024BAD38C|nr:NAD(P)-dependent oxidoreductase [Cryobacterium sp. PH29-G1]MDJ0350754.1 NAD(P)-dependent oxidoreductase [Cryobacterium sp. PH29-G1]
MKVGFVGVGAIGMPMAERLLAHHDVTVYDVTASQVALLAAKGATAASSAAEAAQGADATIVMVATPAQLNSALFGAGGVAEGAVAGSTVIIMSSVGIDSVVRAAEKLDQLGILVLDAPVTGGVVRADTGELTLLIGGDSALVAAMKPVLSLLGTTLAQCGDRVGDGQAVKLVNQLLCSVHLAVAGEALTLADSLGLDPQAVLDIIGSGAASSFMLNDRGPRMLQNNPSVLSAIDIFVKDSTLVQDAAAISGAATPILDAAAARFTQAQLAGLGRSDDSAVIQTYGFTVSSLTRTTGPEVIAVG